MVSKVSKVSIPHDPEVTPIYSNHGVNHSVSIGNGGDL